MNQSYPVPPPELVEQLRKSSGTWLDQITNAYRAGADQELEACCKFIRSTPTIFAADSLLRDQRRSDDLYAARRPKPPSLKEQALDALNLLLMFVPPGDQREQGETIRRALEALDD